MKKKALILYASMSGNTEKIALAFREVFEFYEFTVDLYKSQGEKLKEQQVCFEDYEFVCIGSGLIGGLPMPQLTKLLLSDILKDYYLTGNGIPNVSRSCYKSIS